MFGVAAVAAPTVNLSQALQAPVGGLSLTNLESVHAPAHANWVKEALRKLLGKTIEQKEYERNFVQVHQFDPNVATLRSVSLTAKTRMSRNRLYEKSLELEKMRLQHIGGL